MVKTLACLALIAGAWLITAWALMINISIAHHWWPIIPTIGYTTTLAISAVSMTAGLARVLAVTFITSAAK